MANNYQQFCECLMFPADVGTERLEEIRTWVKAVLSVPSSSEGFDEEAGEKCTEDHLAELEVDTVRLDEHNLDQWPGCDWNLTDDGFILYAEESGDLECVAEFAQAYLKRFAPTGSFRLTWAETCSKMRVGQFGGGYLFVTATDQRWMTPDRWFTEMEEIKE